LEWQPPLMKGMFRSDRAFSSLLCTLKNNLKNMEQSNCEKLNNLTNDFFNFESPSQISEMLSLMLENYIVNAPVEKKDLANASYVVNKLTSFLFTLKELNTKQTDVLSVLIGEENKICLPN
jgi:hypothetical protein